MTTSVFYNGTTPTSIMGQDSPDSAGKVYYRLSVVRVNAWLTLGMSIGFGDALSRVYDALAQSASVIPTSPRPVDDGTDAAVIDVVVSPAGMRGATVGDLVNLVNEATSIVELHRLERVKLQNVSTATQATDRQSDSVAAAAENDADSLTSKVKGFFTTLEKDAKWLIGGIVIIVLALWWFRSRSNSG